MGGELPEKSVLGIFGKQPIPGLVKTRLATTFGADRAAQIHEAMLFDVLDRWGPESALNPRVRRVFVFDPPESRAWFEARTPAGFVLEPQVPGDLGTRMAHFFEAEFARGAERVILIGTDSPTLDPDVILQGFEALTDRHVVLGPATDGGYYLVGCRPPVPPIFDEVSWSTTGVVHQTLSHLEGSGRSLAVLSPWYDVDEVSDWIMMVGHLRALQYAGSRTGLKRLEAILEEMVIN